MPKTQRLIGNKNNLSPDWTSEQIAILRRRWHTNLPLLEIALLLRRSVAAVRNKAYQIGLGPRLPGTVDKFVESVRNGPRYYE